MRGFIVLDYLPRYGEGVEEMARWRSSGELKTREHVVEGLESFPEALLMLYAGENRGKLVVKVGEDD